jgi:hypothetical protein
MGKTVGYVAMFAILLAAAVAGGLLVGTRVRTQAQTGPAPSDPAAPSSASPFASTATPAARPAAPSARTLTIPTIEMK